MLLSMSSAFCPILVLGGISVLVPTYIPAYPTNIPTTQSHPNLNPTLLYGLNDEL